MKIVIDIPNYNNLNDIQNGSIACSQVLRAVKNGTPYEEAPRGDLISRSALKKEVDSWGCENDKYDFLELINNALTVEPKKVVIVPPELIEKLALCVVDIVGNIDWEKAIEAYKARPQGEWIEGEYQDCHSDILPKYTCPFCGEVVYRKYDFCHCGADLRKEKNNETDLH